MTMGRSPRLRLRDRMAGTVTLDGARGGDGVSHGRGASLPSSAQGCRRRRDRRTPVYRSPRGRHRGRCRTAPAPTAVARRRRTRSRPADVRHRRRPGPGDRIRRRWRTPSGGASRAGRCTPTRPGAGRPGPPRPDRRSLGPVPGSPYVIDYRGTLRLRPAPRSDVGRPRTLRAIRGLVGLAPGVPPRRRGPRGRIGAPRRRLPARPLRDAGPGRARPLHPARADRRHRRRRPRGDGPPPPRAPGRRHPGRRGLDGRDDASVP